MTNTPLVSSGTIIFGGAGAIIMSLGALISVSGSDESDMLATSRLSYAMSADGLFPKVFSRVHAKFGTPYVALSIQGLIAILMSVFSSIPGLISFSVFNLGFAFLVSSLALLVLSRRHQGHRAVRLLAIAVTLICAYLIWATSLQDKFIGLTILVAGTGIYAVFSPKVDIPHLKAAIISEATMVKRSLDRRERFLGSFVRFGQRLWQRLNAK